MKLRTENGKWYVEDRGVIKIFETSYDAWCFILLMKEIRINPPIPYRSLYPVRSLNPFPERRCKKIAFTGL